MGPLTNVMPFMQPYSIKQVNIKHISTQFISQMHVIYAGTQVE